MTDIKNILLDVIPFGKENEITSSEISRRTGLKGVEIRKYVNTLRSNGYPVCSDSKGYYLATEASDIDSTISNLNSRISHMIVAREGLRNAKKNIEVNVCG